MEIITENWKGWKDNTEIPISLACYLSQIFVYPASYQSFNFWNKILDKARNNIVCQDCVLLDRDGNQLRVMIHPYLGTLEFLESSFVEISSVIKSTQCGHQVLVISNWRRAKESFPLKFRGELKLESYADQNKPLSNPSSDLLDPWSASNFIWSEKCPLVTKYSLTSVQFNPHVHNLKRLDATWTSISKPIPLVVRVLAKCRERLILQQGNHRKSWMCLSNILIADNTGYSILTIWDEAVAGFHKTVREGDILVLYGSYTPALMRSNHRKLIHNLGPKVRQPTLPLSPTEVELKLNKSDIKSVILVHNGATCDYVPPLISNFVSISRLYEQGAAAGRLVDMVGMVTWHGRWEREATYNLGQFWIRVWVQLVDHSSDRVVNVKMFTDLESCLQLEAAVPGEVVILTNLVCVYQEQKFSHLESSNQTGVYSGDSARDSRFAEAPTVRMFRDAFDNDLQRWINFLRIHGGLGGQFCHGPVVLQNFSILDTESEIINSRQLLEVLSKLPIRCSKRLLVKSRIAGIKTYIVKTNGEIELTEVNFLEKENNKTCHGSSVPELLSLRKALSTIPDRQRLEIALKQFCHLNISAQIENIDNIEFQQTTICVVSLALEDCRVNSIIQPDHLKILQESSADYYMLDCFRLQHSNSEDIWTGVEFVLRQSVELAKESQTMSQDSRESQSLAQESNDTSLLSSTIDLANNFL